MPRITAWSPTNRRHRATFLLLCIAVLSQSGDVSSFTTNSQSRIRPKISRKQFASTSPKTTRSTAPLLSITTGRRSKILLRTAESAADLTNEGDGNNNKKEKEIPGIWPCFDELDGRLIKIALPVIANFAINPLIGAVDLFWINRMGNALAVAGQAAANQVFNSAFWLASFLPSGEHDNWVLTLLADWFTEYLIICLTLLLSSCCLIRR